MDNALEVRRVICKKIETTFNVAVNSNKVLLGSKTILQINKITKEVSYLSENRLSASLLLMKDYVYVLVSISTSQTGTTYGYTRTMEYVEKDILDIRVEGY